MNKYIKKRLVPFENGAETYELFNEETEKWENLVEICMAGGDVDLDQIPEIENAESQ